MGSVKTELSMQKNTININAVNGGETTSIAMDSSANSITDTAKDIKLDAQNSITLKAQTINLEAEQSVTVKGNQQITLKCGPAEIQISPEEVVVKIGPVSVNLNPAEAELSAPEITLEGQAQVGIQGMTINLEGAEITA